MHFPGADLTHLTSLWDAAPERYSQRVLDEATGVIDDPRFGASLRLSRLTRLLNVHQERARTALDPDKTEPMQRLTGLLSLDLLTDADLDGFSPHVRDVAVRMGAIVQIPREIVTRDPDDDPEEDEEVPPPRMLVVFGREVEVRVVTGLPDEYSEARGEAPCHVGIEVEYRGDTKIVESVFFDRIPGWGKIVFEVEMWIDRYDPWSWNGETPH